MPDARIEDETVKATVFIPTLNAGSAFADVLAALRKQETDFPFEILVIDSESRDGTRERAAGAGARVIEIPAETFDHGRTRNLGIHEARGAFVALLTQDAEPADSRWLQRIVSAVESSPCAAGAYCRQIPRPDCDPFIRDRLSRWAATKTERAVQRIEDGAAFWKLEPIDRLGAVAFDNVASCVRRSTALALPFEERRFGEDIAWSLRVLLEGHEIIYEPGASVIHSHNESIYGSFRRVYMDHQNLNQLLGISLVPTWRHLVKNCWGGVGFYGKIAAEAPGLGRIKRLWWRLYGIPYGVMQVFAQYLGPRSNRWREKSRLYRAFDRLIVRRG